MPAATAVTVVAVAITMAAERGVVARANALIEPSFKPRFVGHREQGGQPTNSEHHPDRVIVVADAYTTASVFTPKA